MITIDQLRNTFTLGDDGRVFWKIDIRGYRNNCVVKSGSEAGHFQKKGYRVLTIGGVHIMAHRAVFAMTHGRWPTDQIDHINGNKADNRPCNLREASGFQNQQNRGVNKNAASGVKNVHWSKHARKWRVSLMVNRKVKDFGYHDDLEFAGLVASEARRKYHGIFAAP